MALAFKVPLLLFALGLAAIPLSPALQVWLIDALGKANVLRAGSILLWGALISNVVLLALASLSWKQKATSIMAPVAAALSLLLFAYGEITPQVVVSGAFEAMEPIQTEIARQGCQTGSRSLPGNYSYLAQDIAAIDVTNDMTDTGRRICTITVTFSGKRPRTATLAGDQVKLMDGQNGKWACSSGRYVSVYLPRSCR